MAESTANPRNIYQRMVEVQKVVTSVQKNEVVKMHDNDRGYKAVTHDDVAAALHKPLADCGVFMLPDIESFETTQFDKTNQYGKTVTWYRTDIKILVKWVNVDSPEDFIQSRGAAFALDTSDKSFAKAYSLALKIVLLKVHLLESRDGEEERIFENEQGHQTQKNQPPKNTQKQQAPPAPKAQSATKPAPKVDELTQPFPPDETAKPQDEKVIDPKDPGEFVVLFGNKTTGKKIRQIDEATLKEMLKYTEGQLKIVPPVNNMNHLFQFQMDAKKFLKSVGVEV